MGVISKLDAVNHMLLMAGESLVSDLDTDSDIDTEVARFILDTFVRDFQMRGLANNRYVHKYKLTSEGKILLSSTFLSAELVSNHVTDDGYNIIGIMKGDNPPYLFNVTAQTDQWDADVEFSVEIIANVSWEDMDTPVQRSILCSSAREYQLVTQGDGDTDNYLAQMEAVYMAKGRAADVDDKRRNIFLTTTPRMHNALNRSSGFSNDPAQFRYWRTRG